MKARLLGAFRAWQSRSRARAEFADAVAAAAQGQKALARIADPLGRAAVLYDLAAAEMTVATVYQRAFGFGPAAQDRADDALSCSRVYDLLGRVETAIAIGDPDAVAVAPMSPELLACGPVLHMMLAVGDLDARRALLPLMVEELALVASTTAVQIVATLPFPGGVFGGGESR